MAIAFVLGSMGSCESSRRSPPRTATGGHRARYTQSSHHARAFSAVRTARAYRAPSHQTSTRASTPKKEGAFSKCSIVNCVECQTCRAYGESLLRDEWAPAQTSSGHDSYTWAEPGM